MVGLCPLAQRGVFHFDEIAHMHLRAQHRTRTQPGKWPDQRAFANRHAGLLAIDMGERMDHRACSDRRIGDHTVGTDLHVVSQADAAFEYTVDVNRHILSTLQVAAYIKARRIGNPHTTFHQPVRQPLLEGALQLRQLQRAVHTCHLHRIGDLVRYHLDTIGHSKLHDVRQVILLLRVVIVQPGQPGFELARRQGHDAAVDFLHRQLGCIRVFLLDDALHRRARTDHAAITRRVIQFQRQQRQARAGAKCNQVAQCLPIGQRHVATEHHHDTVIRQHRYALLHGVASAQLRLLPHKAHIQRSQRVAQRATGRFHGLGPVPGDHHRAAGTQASRSGDHMVQQGAPGQSVQYFRQFAFHAGAFARRHDDYIQHCLVFHVSALVSPRYLEADYRPARRAHCPAFPARLQRGQTGLQQCARAGLLVD